MSTKDIIQTNINSRLTSQPTQIEGGTVEDIVGSVSYELANIIDTRIDIILDNAFITTADDEHLKIRGEELGIYQKEAVNSILHARISNAQANILIQSGFIAYTDDEIRFQSIEDVMTDETGTAVVKMQCLQSGVTGNISVGALKNLENGYEGLNNAEIINIEAGYDGFEAETTEEYRQRILEYIKDDAINSNAYDYQKWAKSVNGVNKVIVHDAFIAGAGNVNVYISNLNNTFVSDELIETVKAKIKKEQIINANVNVFSLEPVEINIQATVNIQKGRTLEEIKAEFESKVLDYLENAENNVSYLFISNLLFGITGVLDVSEYYLNGGDLSIRLTELQVPHLNNITLINNEEN